MFKNICLDKSNSLQWPFYQQPQCSDIITRWNFSQILTIDGEAWGAFVSETFDVYFASVILYMFTAPRYIAPRYNGTRMY